MLRGYTDCLIHLIRVIHKSRFPRAPYLKIYVNTLRMASCEHDIFPRLLVFVHIISHFVFRPTKWVCNNMHAIKICVRMNPYPVIVQAFEEEKNITHVE